jgi:hypothetical protein
MKTTLAAVLPESCPAGLNCRLGVIRSRSPACRTSRSRSVSALKAEMAMGVSCRLSSTRRAVTVTLSSPVRSFSVSSTTTDWPAVSTTPSRVSAPKPLASALIR